MLHSQIDQITQYIWDNYVKMNFITSDCQDVIRQDMRKHIVEVLIPQLEQRNLILTEEELKQ